MSFSSDVTLDKANGASVPFARIGSDINTCRYIDTDTNLSEPITLEIKHATSGSNGSVVDRHLVSFKQVVAATPVPQTLVVNFTIQTPRHAAITDQMVYDRVANLITFLNPTNEWTDGDPMSGVSVKKLLRNEA